MKKFFTLFIILILLPITALAAGEDAPSTLYVGDTAITSGYWTSSNGGTTWTYQSSMPSEGSYIHYDGNGTLTLNGATIKGGSSVSSIPYGAGIYALCSDGQSVSLTIELIGENTIEGNYGILVEAQQGGITGINASLIIKSESGSGSSSLKVTGSGNYGISVKSGTGDASLTIENTTVNASTSGGHVAGVYVQSGVDATSSPRISLAVNGGSLTASGGSESSKGILFYVGSPNATNPTTKLTVGGNAIVDAKTGGISASGANWTDLNVNVGYGDSDNGGIVFDGTAGTVYGNVTLDESLTINQGETLTVPEGAKLDCNGNLTNSGTILVESGGTLTGEPEGSTVVRAPSITTQPTNTSVTAGNTAAFTVEATGDDLSYQWQQKTTNSESDWADISGAISASYTTAATTAAMNGYQYRCVVSNSAGSVTSEAATLTVVEISITTESLPDGEVGSAYSQTLKADGDGTITWSLASGSSLPAGLSLSEDGTISGTPTTSGTFNFTVTATNSAGSASKEFSLTINPKPTVSVTGVTLDQTELSLFTGESETLTAAVQPSDATNQNVTWQSDNANVATVQNGTVTAVGAGEANITVTTEDGGKTATCEVKVRNQVEVEPSGSTNLSFTTDRDEFTLTATVHAQGNDLDPKDDSWTWTVADKDVVALSGSPTLLRAFVSSSRQAFTVEGTGTTTITATYDDGTYRGSVDFTVHISKPAPPDPISYYNIYVEDVCDGVEVTTSKNVVREGNSISVYVEKDTADYDFDNFQVYYKRSYYGPWEVLEEGTQPGEYPINNIWTHIYIKAEGAIEKEDPTGIEQVEGVKVYTKDGSLYVQTPQREQVLVITMTGVVVKNEEQVGLKQYHGLQPGIYVVRAGNAVYKVRLH